MILLDCSGVPESYLFDKGETLEEAKRQIVIVALYLHGWNRTHTARSLGISLRGMRYLIQNYGLSEFGLKSGGTNEK